MHNVLVLSSHPNATLMEDGSPVISAEAQLLSNLLRGYEAHGKIARPVTDSSRAVKVEFGLRLGHVDLNEKEQVMEFSAWVRLVSWNL